MKNLTQRLHQHLISPFHKFSAATLVTTLAGALTLTAIAVPIAVAATPKTRISAEITSSQMTALPGSKSPLAVAENDAGRLPAATRLEGISLYFNRTPQQQAAVEKLIADQQNPSSPSYHQWLTPEEFGARFGMPDADIAKVQGWLEQQGFSVDSVARSRNMIRFSGTAAQVEQAFGTEMHSYHAVAGAKTMAHFAPSTPISVPSALAGVVLAVRNLDDFRPRSHVVFNKARHNRPTAHFTGADGSLFFAPGDVAVEYDINPSYSAGNNGEGQKITIVGQSAILNSDIEAFESASGLPAKDPVPTLVPGTGNSVESAGDETESDIDLEWSGAVAKGATINFVYVGSNLNYSVFDAIVYAIDNQIGTIISSSYGECEAGLSGETLGNGAAAQTTLEAAFQQAATQGQTVVSASGDDGATDCFQGNTSGNPSQSLQDSLAVDYPGSSQYVTSVGGTEISQANSNYLTPGEGYWTDTNGSTDIVTSVLKYIPEQAWNEDSSGCGQADCIASGGGGASSLFGKPSWQTALTPADGHRDVPDISLGASINSPGYLFCSSDESDWSQFQQSSCTSGFRDSATGDPTWAGGTSFAAPIFAGMVAIINQQQGYTAGQGLVNSTLYSLAGNAGTYASAFHDISSGNNDCPKGTGLCFSTVTGYAAKAGYDQATGLGTIDLGNLVGVWPASTGPTLISTTTTVTASNVAPVVNTADNFSIAVTSDTGSTVPAGTVAITVDSGTAVNETLASNGTFTYSFTFTAAGSHTVLVAYSGDTTHAASTGSANVTVTAVSSGTGTFTLAATSVTVAQGATGSSTITATPKSGYTGTIDLNFDTSNDNALANLCAGFSDSLSDGEGTVVISNATTASTVQLIFDTNAADCSGAATRKIGKVNLRSVRAIRSGGNATGKDSGSKGPGKTAPLSIAFAGLLLAGFLGRSSRKLRGLASVIVLAALGLVISACGGSGSNSVSDPPKGTYTITLTGTDSTSSTIPTATTTFTFTIQ